MTGSFSDRDSVKTRFHELDYRIMKHAFEIHNRMGNFHDEEVYKNELFHLIQQDGITVQKEVPLSIEFRSFKKTYFMDLLIESNHVYELKALLNLTNQCRSQTINYQLIAEKPYGKLINFGGQSVEHEFVTSILTKNERQTFEVNQTNWDEARDVNQQFYALANDLIGDWGTRLDPGLYSDALLELMPDAKKDRIEIISDNRPVGSKLVQLLKPGIAFKLTTSKKPKPLEVQFQKFINHTRLKALFWINLNQDQISFHTLRKK